MKNWMRFFLRSFLCLSLAAGAAVSCYDDSALWDKVTDMENRLNELEVEMQSQVEAMNALLSNGATLTSCKKNSDGSYTVTLSNGTKFNVLPEGTDFSTFITYKVEGGNKYWATYDAAGNAVVLTDASGKPIPVSTDISVKIVDGVYVLVVNGKEYETGYDVEDMVQVFSSCTPLTDASGDVYAVKFTFGEGMEITVTLDGYKGVIFKLSSVNNTVVSEYFIDYGATQSFLMEMPGVVDYVMQVPDGWRVKEVTEELTGETYIRITAPAAETVALGAAVAEGDLKVVSVVEGGKAAVSKMYLSTDPFKTYNISPIKALIEPYAGIQKFAYGLMLTEDFYEDQVVAKVGELLVSSSDLPAGYFISERPIDSTLAEIYGEELVEDVSYVFWAIPVLYREDSETEESGFYVVEEMLRSHVLNPMDVTIKVSEETLLDAQVSVIVNGAEYAYAGTSQMTETLLEEIVYQINNGIIEPISGEIRYKGPASEFPDPVFPTYMEPGTTYITWVVPVEQGKDSYTVSDVVYSEFSTKEIVAGGSIAVTSSELQTTQSSVSASLESSEAAMICYAYLSDEDGTRYSGASDEAKMDKMRNAKTYVEVRGTSAEAVAEYLHPESTQWLFAVAVGHDGKYGEVICKSATTDKVTFNDLSVSVEEISIQANKAVFKVNVSGGTATDYIYWIGKKNDDFWFSDEYCNQNKTIAQKYMAANPDAEQIVDVMKHNGNVTEDGTITVTDLIMSTEYVFLVLAQDKTGNYSKVGYKKFTTLAADLGDVVMSGTEKWNAALNNTVIKWDEQSFHLPANSNMSGSYRFSISCPTDLTAFVVCGSYNFFEGMELATIEQQIVYLENYASRKYDNGHVPYKDGEMMTEPDYYKNGELHKGQLMNVYDFYVHGLPALGFATYFADGDHNDNCIYWDEGACSSYQRALEKIVEQKSIETYRRKAQMFGLQGDEAEAWAQDLLEAYLPFYENAEPIMYVNNGQPLNMVAAYASGLDEDGYVIDRVLVVYRDKQGNYYEPMTIEVPNYFAE